MDLKQGKKWKLILSKFRSFFSNDLEMALIALPRGFKAILKNTRKFEISYHSVEVANINIWIPFRFSQKIFNFSQMVYKWPSQRFRWLLKQF